MKSNVLNLFIGVVSFTVIWDPCHAPIQGTDLLGLWSVPWEQGGVRAGLVLAADYPPPTPLPLAPFFFGAAPGDGG